jgi:hypothetical protein
MITSMTFAEALEAATAQYDDAAQTVRDHVTDLDCLNSGWPDLKSAKERLAAAEARLFQLKSLIVTFQHCAKGVVMEQLEEPPQTPCGHGVQGCKGGPD